MFSNLDQLKRFVAVAEAGTVHRAAEAMGLTQPAVTRSIKLLENSMGAQLFERRARGVHLTPLGKRTLQHARHILRECQLADTDLRALREGETGTLKIAAAPVWMSTILPQTIARLHQDFPQLSITLDALHYSDAVPKLQNGELDMFCGGFQSLENLPSFLVRKAVFKAQLNIVARESHPIFRIPSITAQDLLAFPWLSYQSDLAYLDTLMTPIEEQTGHRATARVFCDSMLTALELLREGNYLAYLPGSLGKSVYGVGLSVVETNLDNATFESGLIYRRSLTTSAAFNRLCDLANQRLSELELPAPSG